MFHNCRDPDLYIRTRLVFSTVTKEAYDKITDLSILIKKIPFKLAIFVMIAYYSILLHP